MKKQAALIIFSGLPASGKTTLSSKLATYLQAVYIRMDAIVLGLKSDTYDPDLPSKCYAIARSLALINLQLGSLVVTDSINPFNNLREEWRLVAQTAGVKSLHIEIICTNKDEHQNRLKHRTTTLNGLIDPTWDEILKIEYHLWDQERIVIDTACKTAEESFNEILYWLKNSDFIFVPTVIP